jgi:hypothetical protein
MHDNVSQDSLVRRVITVNNFPAPWNLKGRGYILLYHFPKEFVLEKGYVPKELKKHFVGGIGSIMLVDYQESTAGPYQELLFIPGKFKWQGRKLASITKIYVSTETSVQNGQINWGIPKELGNFHFETLSKDMERIQVTVGGEIALTISLHWGKIAFPVHTALLPFPLLQFMDEQYYYTKFHGSGKGRFATIEEVFSKETLFPDVSEIKPLAAFRVDDFRLIFPVAEIKLR